MRRFALAASLLAMVTVSGCGTAYAPAVMKATSGVAAHVKVVPVAERGALTLTHVKRLSQGNGFLAGDGFELRGRDAVGAISLVLSFHRRMGDFDSSRFTFDRNFAPVRSEADMEATVKQLLAAKGPDGAPEAGREAAALIRKHFRAIPSNERPVGADWFEPMTIAAVTPVARPAEGVKEAFRVKGRNAKGDVELLFETLEWWVPGGAPPVRFLRVTTNGHIERAVGVVRWWHTNMANAEIAPGVALNEVESLLRLIEDVATNRARLLGTKEWPKG